MDLQEIFKRLGLPKHADTVYDFLNKRGQPELVARIAKACKLHRMTVYRCLEKLAALDLVKNTTAGKRTLYTCGSPYNLTAAMKVTEAATEKIAERNLKIREKDVPQNVRFLYGPAGIREAFNDVINHTSRGDMFFRYTSEQDLARVNQYLPKDYRERRDQKKLERQVISNYVSGRLKKSRLERFIKFIPTEGIQFEQNIIQLVYGDRVSVIDLNNEEVLLIENHQLAEFQKVIFKLLYKRL